MKTLKHFTVFTLLIILFSSCTVTELEDDSLEDENQIENIKATDDSEEDTSGNDNDDGSKD